MQSILMDFKLWSSFILVGLTLSCNQTSNKGRKLQGFAFGTTYNIQYVSNVSQEEVQKGIDSIFYVLNKSLSTYLPQSDISKINRGDSILVVDQHFKAVFEKTTEVWNATNGYFDPTVGALVNAYGFGPEITANSVSKEKIDSLLQLTGWEKIKLTAESTLKKKSPHIYLDFNALAKGYAVDVVGYFLHDLGSKNYMVEIGGEIVVRGNSPKTQKRWKIAIDDPRQGQQREFIQTLYLSDQALASSGNYRKHKFDPTTGERYVHSINPHTGSAQKTNILSTSVKAPDCMTADAWATALMVMPLEMGEELIENHPNLEALWIVANKDKMITVTSKNW